MCGGIVGPDVTCREGQIGQSRNKGFIFCTHTHTHTHTHNTHTHTHTQFYCDRVSQLAHLKHMLLLRWARFSLGQPSVTEELQTHFKERMESVA